MKFVVPIALSVLATLLAVIATRLIARSRAPFDLDDFPASHEPVDHLRNGCTDRQGPRRDPSAGDPGGASEGSEARGR